MRATPLFAIAAVFSSVLLQPMAAHAQPAGSSPEAAMEALLSQQREADPFVPAATAQVQALLPACQQAAGVSADVQGHRAMTLSQQQAISSCVQSMQSSLGWLEPGAFAACPSEGIRRPRVQACETAVSTFLLQHGQGDEAEAQTTASLALMNDLCSPTALCAPEPAESADPDGR